MNIIEKYNDRVKNYGKKFVWMNIIPNNIQRKLNLIVLELGKIIFRGAQIKNKIIIESHNDFDCNSGALYNYLIKHKYNEKYKIVWLVKNKIKQQLPKNVIALNIWKPSIKKAWEIATAKYLFNDDSFIKKMKKEQVAVYCTHGGCALKNVQGIINVPDYVDYILSSSKNFDPIMCKNYSIPYPNNKMLHFGFPSSDVFFEESGNELLKITNKTFDKVILWMPTFRKNKYDYSRNDSLIEQPLGIPLFTDIEQLKEVNKTLTTCRCLLIIKIHPMQDPLTYSELKNFSNIIVIDAVLAKKLDIDNYRLMKVADAFISDYSSSTYSFLLLNRPIGFVLEDINSYKLGFIVSNISKFLPGQIIKNKIEFVSFIKQICEGDDIFINQREDLTEWLYENRTGKSTEKLVNFLKL